MISGVARTPAFPAGDWLSKRLPNTLRTLDFGL